MQTTLRLVKIGNSRGIRLPAALIRRHGLSEQVRVLETAEGLLLRAEKTGKIGLEESFAAMANDPEAVSEARRWAESGVADGLGDEQFRGWPR